jgi:hypothetical protein
MESTTIFVVPTVSSFVSLAVVVRGRFNIPIFTHCPTNNDCCGNHRWKQHVDVGNGIRDSTTTDGDPVPCSPSNTRTVCWGRNFGILGYAIPYNSILQCHFVPFHLAALGIIHRVRGFLVSSSDGGDGISSFFGVCCSLPTARRIRPQKY